METFKVAYPGSWLHIVSYNNSLGCSLVYDQDSTNMGFLKWNKTKLDLVGTFPSSSFMTGNESSFDFKRQFMVNEDCSLLSFTNYPRNGTNITNMTNLTISTTLYIVSSDWSTLTPATEPPFWQP